MFRKVTIIFISVLLQGLGTRIQAFSVFFVIIVFIMITARHKPYLSRQMNDLELISLVTSGVTISSRVFFLSSLDSSLLNFNPSKDFELSFTFKWIFFALILLSNAFFLMSWLYYFFQEIQDKCRQKVPRIYKCCCLCCRDYLFA